MCIRDSPDVFRPKEKMMSVMPIGLVATLMAILVVTIMFAMIHQGGSGTTEGARLGVLIGIFVVCAFVPVSYTHLDVYKRQISTHISFLMLAYGTGSNRERKKAIPRGKPQYTIFAVFEVKKEILD